MTLVFLQYPALLLVFLFSAGMLLAVFLAGKHPRIPVLLPAAAAALSVSALIFLGFYYAIPVKELFLLVLALLLLCCALLQEKGGRL